MITNTPLMQIPWPDENEHTETWKHWENQAKAVEAWMSRTWTEFVPDWRDQNNNQLQMNSGTLVGRWCRVGPRFVLAQYGWLRGSDTNFGAAGARYYWGNPWSSSWIRSGTKAPQPLVSTTAVVSAVGQFAGQRHSPAPVINSYDNHQLFVPYNGGAAGAVIPSSSVGQQIAWTASDYARVAFLYETAYAAVD